MERDLHKMAEGFPPVAATNAAGKFLTKQVKRSGADLIKENYQPAKGQPKIVPELMYMVNEIQYVNHKNKLIIAFQKDGWDGVLKYQAYIDSLKSAGLMQIEELVNGKKWYYKAWKYLGFYSSRLWKKLTFELR